MKTSLRSAGWLLGGCAVVLVSLGACRSTAGSANDPTPGREADAGAAAAADEVGEPSSESHVWTAVDLSGWQVATGDDGVFDLAWRPVGGTVPRNEVFELEVMLLQDGQLLAGPQVRVRGWMPDHGHGLVRTPLVTDLGGGRHRVEGLLLHMRGLWQLFFDVTDGRRTDCVGFEWSL